MYHTYPRPLAILGEDSADLLAPLEEFLQEHQVNLTPLVIPYKNPRSLTLALGTLEFAGAIVDPSHWAGLASHLERLNGAARDAGAVDTLSRMGIELSGSFLLGEALQLGLERSLFQAKGARLMILGSGPLAYAAASVARQGFSRVVVAADNLPEAERLKKVFPANLERYSLSIHDSALLSLLERTDLVIQAGHTLPTRLWQPYHTVLDLMETEAATTVQRVGGHVISPLLIQAEHLRLQLEQISGQRFQSETFLELMHRHTGM